MGRSHTMAICIFSVDMMDLTTNMICRKYNFKTLSLLHNFDNAHLRRYSKKMTKEVNLIRILELVSALYTKRISTIRMMIAVS